MAVSTVARAPELTPALVAASSPLALAAMCRIDGPAGPERLVLWAHQRRMLGALVSERLLVVLKARQLGATWVLAIYALWYVIAHPARTVLVLSIGEREAQVVLRRVRRLHASLPAAVRGAFPISRGAQAGERIEIGHPEGEAAIVCLPSSGGRSETAHVVLLDEGAHWEHTDDRLAAVLPAAADAGQVALVSTGNGLGGRYAQIWSGAPSNGWTPLFLGAAERPGRDRGWVLRERAMIGHLGVQELPLNPTEALVSSGHSPFDASAIQALHDYSARPPDHGWQALRRTPAGLIAEPVPAGTDSAWEVWEWPKTGRQYLIAADSCGGQGGQDFAAAAVYDVESWDQVAALGGRPEPAQLADLIRWAGWFWRADALTPALLVPESNNHGQAVVALLKEWRYPRIYSSETFDQRTQKTTKTLGWTTTAKSRELMIASLQEAVREGTLGIRDAAALAQMQRFVDNDGRYEAGPGAHDDIVIVQAIAAAVLSRSRKARPVRHEPQPAYIPRVSARSGY